MSNEKIKLDYPFSIAGQAVTELTVRRPKVKDLRKASRYGETAAEQEVGLLSSLTGCTPEDLDEMDAADYGKLQSRFRDMVEPTATPDAHVGDVGAEVQVPAE